MGSGGVSSAVRCFYGKSVLQFSCRKWERFAGKGGCAEEGRADRVPGWSAGEQQETMKDVVK
jgi:hypothetical protein